MVTKSGQAFDAWRHADQAARNAEHILQEAWNDYALGKGAPPSRDLIHEVSRLRAAAHEKLSAAIAVVGEQVDSRRSPGSPTRDRPSSR
jgi:hypothetical protein